MDTSEIERHIGGPVRLAYEDIVQNPRLPEARRVYLDRFLALYGADPFAVRLLMESGRFLVYHLTVTLDAAHDPERPETWLTVSLLKRNMAAFGLTSGRHVDSLIGRLCAIGYVELLRSDKDRRIRLLRPAERARAHDRDWLVAHYSPLAVLYPQHDYGLIMRRDPAFHAVYRRRSAAFIALGAKCLHMSPDMLLFFNHAGGVMVAAALLQAAMARPDQHDAAFPYGAIGERFGLSRTQVRKLLVAAEEAGLIKLHARGGRRVEVLPRLYASYDKGLAAGMYVHDIAYLAALREWAGARASSENSEVLAVSIA